MLALLNFSPFMLNLSPCSAEFLTVHAESLTHNFSYYIEFFGDIRPKIQEHLEH